VPVELHIDTDERLPEPFEVALYYVVCEALTNALKHAYATVVRIDLNEEDGHVRLRVRDNGVGGADPTRGSGLVGLDHRVRELGGTLDITSHAGKGTSLLVTIPLPPV
jgi:signal transduction histidine kinase